jgi:N-acetylmuramoyl-L-alanine amidase
MADWKFEMFVDPNEYIKKQGQITRRLDKIVLHYSAVEHPPLGKLLEHIAAIDKWHREHNGWSGIGYHIAVHPSGYFVSCRPLNLVGAHCRGHNIGSIGVVMLCDEEYLKSSPPLLQWTTIKLLKALCSAYNIDRAAVFLHKQFNQTNCPPISEAFEKYLHEAGFTSIRRDGK